MEKVFGVKAFDKGRTSTHKSYVWPSREWTEPQTPVLCESGWHGYGTLSQLLDSDHLGKELWLVEFKGQIVTGDDKVAAEQARLVRKLTWTDKERRLFAADCAEHVLPLFEAEFPGDSRPREAIECARRFVAGEATAAELDAARAASGDAALAAAGASWASWAAWAAAAAGGARAAWAAWAAAAAGNASWAAAGAAGAAERVWQAQRLAHYLGIDGEVS